jgi:glutamine amidotransferase
MIAETRSASTSRATRVAILDYGVGNLHSLAHAINTICATVVIETDPMIAIDADLLVLPGVGSYASAARHLNATRSVLRDRLEGGLPCLGICLGMQLLLAESDEGPGLGIGVIAGRVERLRTERVPHMGWNAVDVPLLRGTAPLDPMLERSGLKEAYYANSYVCRPRDVTTVTAWSDQDAEQFPSILRCRSTIGVQFHPEKSGAPGLQFLRAVVDDATSSPTHSAARVAAGEIA